MVRRERHPERDTASPATPNRSGRAQCRPTLASYQVTGLLGAKFRHKASAAGSVIATAGLPDPSAPSRLPHFGGTDAAIEQMRAVRREWETDGTLPDDIDDLGACLFLEYAASQFVEHDDVFTVWHRHGRSSTMQIRTG